MTALSFIVGFAGGVVVATGLGRLGMDRADILRTVLGVVIVALVGYSTFTTNLATSELARQAQCQTTQNEQFRDALAARADATTRGNDAQREFLASVGDPTVGPEVEAEALTRYLAALDGIDASRARNPLTAMECR